MVIQECHSDNGQVLLIGNELNKLLFKTQSNLKVISMKSAKKSLLSVEKSPSLINNKL